MTEITRWLYLSDLDHLQVREWINGLWFAVSFAMCLELGNRLVRRIIQMGAKWRDDIGARAVLALFGYFAGETLMRGWIWVLLALQNAHHPWAMQVQKDYLIAFVAATMSTWSALCCLYVFSRNHWAWVRAACVVVVFVVIEAVLF